MHTHLDPSGKLFTAMRNELMRQIVRCNCKSASSIGFLTAQLHNLHRLMPEWPCACGGVYDIMQVCVCFQIELSYKHSMCSYHSTRCLFGRLQFVALFFHLLKCLFTGTLSLSIFSKARFGKRQSIRITATTNHRIYIEFSNKKMVIIAQHMDFCSGIWKFTS